MGLLHKSKKKLEAELDAMALGYISDGVIILGADGNIRLINPAATRLIGQGVEEVLGVSFLSVVHLVDAHGRAVGPEVNPVRVAMRAQTGGTTRALSILPAGGDRAVPVELTVQLAAESGSAILTLRDIARELKGEEARNDFISTASHEMRTPVASIEGFIGLAINPQTATIDARAMNYLTRAHAASQHLGKLFRDLLDTTKLEDKRITLRPVPTEMVAAVKTIVDSMGPMVAAKGLKYIFDSGTIPGAKIVTPMIYAMVDMDFLWQVLDNLIDNAVKYTPRGEVRVTVRGDETNVIVGVLDTGIGIDASDLPHLFQKFYRADTTETQTIGGTGLGLFIAKERVEALGGRMWAESKPGAGSQFYFTLPRLSQGEYERRKLVAENEGKMVTNKPGGV